MKKNIRKTIPKKTFKKEIKKTRTPEESKEGASTEKNKRLFHALRGMHDSLPKEDKYWRRIFQNTQELADHFQFARIDTPVLEEASLFVRTIGRGTDVVDKEMYVFEDRDGTKVCLRPEMTAGVARAYIANGMWNMPQPVKLWYWGPMFRHDRPQAGRYRQFNQVGFENLGSHDPAVDAELILIAYNLVKDLGLPVEIKINSIGTVEERVRYKQELTNYYRSKRAYLCDDCKNRLSKNPLRLLDCKQPQCQGVKETAPQIIDYLETESKNHFMRVLEFLDVLAVPYQLDHTLVRGLDYYTHTVFELYPTFLDNSGAQSALGGGGRYNLLVQQMGGRETPAAGFSLGLERLVFAWKQYNEQNNIQITKEPVEIFVAQLGEDARRATLKLINELRGSGIRLAFNFFKTSLKSQLELADNLKTIYTIIIGQKEVQDSTAIIRDMESGNQEVVDAKKLIAILKKKLAKNLTETK